jgi:hypothetical protein
MHLVYVQCENKKKLFLQISLLLDPDPDLGEPNQRGANVDPDPKLLLAYMLLGPT